MLSWRRRYGTKASVAVEFALVSTFLLLPLFAGGADFVEIISGQGVLNTTLQEMALYAYTNPTSANASYASVVLAYNNIATTHQMTLPATTSNGTPNFGTTYDCLNAAGATAAYGSSCPAGYTKRTFVSIQLTSSINLSAPVPFLPNPFPLQASAKIQVQ